MANERHIWSVAELNRRARHVLEDELGACWVEGEISRLTRHASGHWYFTLKDEKAAVSCAMFKANNLKVAFAPKDGMKVQVYAQASLYEARGSYQLIVTQMDEAGRGTLQEQFEKLKAKLAEEGLFEPARKKSLPLLPRKIGVVTSPTGAAIRDIINVLTRRFPNVEILLAPVTVQGAGSEKRIARAIEYLGTRKDIDVIIAGRGGGSLEDLWCFNEEVVARAIAACPVPLISAVGHEIDFTIADFVADVRAPTPSAAAELAVPDKADLQARIERARQRLRQGLKHRELELRSRLNKAAGSYVFREPRHLVRQYRDRVAQLERAGATALERRFQQVRQQLDHGAVRMERLLSDCATEYRRRLERAEVRLQALSPMAVLGRGYSLTRRPDGSVLRSAAELECGEEMVTLFAEGSAVSTVREVRDGGKES